MEHHSTADVIVIGGGAVGVACAYELSRRGVRVTLIEREPDFGLGCSFGSAGLLGPLLAFPLATPRALKDGVHWIFDPSSPFHLHPRFSSIPWLLRFVLASTPARSRLATQALAPLAADAWQMHFDYKAEGVDTGIERNGTLLTWETEPAFEVGRRELRDAGIQGLTLLTAAQARDLEPTLTSNVVGAVAAQDMAHTDSVRWTRGVGRAARTIGTEVVTAQVRRLVAERGRIVGVETDAGVLRAGAVVVAAGVWSAELLRPVGVRVPLEAGKGYHVDLEPAEREPTMPVYMQEAHVVATPLGRCLRLAGTLELTSLDSSINPTRAAVLVQAGERNLAGVRSRKVQNIWVGFRPCAADGLPVIGRSVKAEGLVIATGHSMIGLFLAPVTGRLVAQMIASEQPAHDLTLFEPDRF